MANIIKTAVVSDTQPIGKADSLWLKPVPVGNAFRESASFKPEYLSTLPESGVEGVMYVVGPKAGTTDEYETFLWNGESFVSVTGPSVDSSAVQMFYTSLPDNPKEGDIYTIPEAIGDDVLVGTLGAWNQKNGVGILAKKVFESGYDPAAFSSLAVYGLFTTGSQPGPSTQGTLMFTLTAAANQKILITYPDTSTDEYSLEYEIMPGWVWVNTNKMQIVEKVDYYGAPFNWFRVEETISDGQTSLVEYFSLFSFRPFSANEYHDGEWIQRRSMEEVVSEVISDAELVSYKTQNKSSEKKMQARKNLGLYRDEQVAWKTEGDNGTGAIATVAWTGGWFNNYLYAYPIKDENDITDNMHLPTLEKLLASGKFYDYSNNEYSVLQDKVVQYSEKTFGVKYERYSSEYTAFLVTQGNDTIEYQSGVEITLTTPGVYFDATQNAQEIKSLTWQEDSVVQIEPKYIPDTVKDTFVVTFSNIDPITADKTYSEIDDARNSGKVIIGRYLNSEYIYTYEESQFIHTFTSVSYDSDPEPLMSIRTIFMASDVSIRYRKRKVTSQICLGKEEGTHRFGSPFFSYAAPISYVYTYPLDVWGNKSEFITWTVESVNGTGVYSIINDANSPSGKSLQVDFTSTAASEIAQAIVKAKWDDDFGAGYYQEQYMLITFKITI